MLREITHYNALNGTKKRVILSYGDDNYPTGKIVFTNQKCDADTTFDENHCLYVLSPSTLGWVRLADVKEIAPHLIRRINSRYFNADFEETLDEFTDACEAYMGLVYGG